MRNRLISTLERLLVEHDCVVVPQFGAFIREFVPSVWDSTHNMAYPPSVTLRFNEALQHQDGLLLEAYALDLGLSKRLAKLELENDVQHLKQSLLRQQSLALEGLGAVRLSPEGSICFSSAPSERINYRYYGLRSVASPWSVGQEPSLSLKDDKYLRINIPKRALRYAGVVAVFLIVLLLPLSLWRSTLPSYEASFVPDRAVVQKAIKSVYPSLETDEVKPREEPKPTSQSVWQEAESTYYYVIIGTERRESIAQKYIELYQAKYPELAILKSKQLYRISAKQFKSSSEAQAYLRELAREGVSAWIYHL